MLDLDRETIEGILEMVAAMNGDDPEERRGIATATVRKRQAGEPITGLPTFLEHLSLGAFDKTLRKWLRFEDGASLAPNPGAISLDQPENHVIIGAIALLLSSTSGRIFDRDGVLSRLKRLKQSETLYGVNRSVGSVKIVPVDAQWLAYEAGRVGRFRKGNRSASPPTVLMAMVIAAADDFPFPPLTAVSLTPLLDRDEPGYDEATGIYLDFPLGFFPMAPQVPTRAQAESALAALLHPLRCFPFVNLEARAVAVAGMLAAVIRAGLRTCPMFLFDAPAARTGKTKLAEMLGMLALGTSPAAIAYAGRADEDEKRLDSVLRAGDQVLLIDNVSADIEGDALCSMLTNETVQLRTLGKSETVKVSTRTLVIATGNNLRLRGDVAHRALLCRLDAKMANPDERAFDFDPVDEVRRDRGALVMAALTLLRAYRAAGRPDMGLKPFGGFSDFDLIRGALVWLGQPDPASTRDQVKGNDAALEERVQAISLIAAGVGLGVKFTVQTLGTHAGHDRLRKALCALLGLSDWSGAKVGQLLRRCRGVPTRGLVVHGEPSGANVMEWWISGDADEAMQQHIEAMGCDAM